MKSDENYKTPNSILCFNSSSSSLSIWRIHSKADSSSISVCSGGGSTHHALALADKIGNLRVPTISIVEGYSCSAATFISMSANVRQITPNSFMMVHQVWMSLYGKHDELNDYMNWTDKLMEQASKFYVAHTKLTQKKVGKLLRKDRFFNAEECLSLGFVDEIL